MENLKEKVEQALPDDFLHEGLIILDEFSRLKLKVEVPPPEVRRATTEFLSFRKTVPALTADHDIQFANLTGTIYRIVVHFPAGCCSLVAVKVFHGGKQILPRMGVLALDDTTQPFEIFEPVKSGDPIRIDFENHDGIHSHTVSVVVGLKEGGIVEKVAEEGGAEKKSIEITPL